MDESKKPKLRVAAYCRVSTQEEQQLGSFEMQVRHFRQRIEGNPEWELVDIYQDEGITFSKKLLEDLSYPSHVLFQLDAKNRVFAIRPCRSNEQRAFVFSKPRNEQQTTLSISNKNLLKPIRECTADIWEPKERYKIEGFWVADAKTMCFDLNEEIPKSYWSDSYKKNEADDE